MEANPLAIMWIEVPVTVLDDSVVLLACAPHTAFPLIHLFGCSILVRAIDRKAQITIEVLTLGFVYQRLVRVCNYCFKI